MTSGSDQRIHGWAAFELFQGVCSTRVGEKFPLRWREENEQKDVEGPPGVRTRPVGLEGVGVGVMPCEGGMVDTQGPKFQKLDAGEQLSNFVEAREMPRVAFWKD